jgi:hypothetical protein
MTRRWENEVRLAGLRRFATAITILNLLGHTALGFEQSPLQPVVGLAAAYATELLLDWIGHWSRGARPGWTRGFRALVDFLLPAHITGLAVAMLLYTNERLWVTAFAAALSIASKTLLRAPSGQTTRHFFNPSNLGIASTLLLFPWVGIAPPYMFTENIDSPGDWVMPGLIVCTGTFLNARFTNRLPMIAAWLSCFVLQAVARHLITGSALAAALAPMTGVAFILFTFYMLPEPSTTPSSALAQVAFGASTAIAYGVLMSAHIVFGLFFALCFVSAWRGASMYVHAWRARREEKPVFALASAQGD